MNVPLSVPAVRPLPPAPQALYAAIPPLRPFTPMLTAKPAPLEAPRLALPALQAAQTAPDASPAVLLSAGRAAFDSQRAVPGQDAVPASFSMPSPLARPQAWPLQGAVTVPASLPLAAAIEPTGMNILIAVGVALIALAVIRFLPFNRPKAPLPRPPMPLAGTELPELRAQMGVLMERLYASAAGIRDPRRASRAIDAEWGKLRADGGVAEWRPNPGEWALTPIHGSLFEAIALPETLRLLERHGGGRYGDQLADLLRGLSLEPERASSADDLYARLRWWPEHFRQFAPR